MTEGFTGSTSVSVGYRTALDLDPCPLAIIEKEHGGEGGGGGIGESPPHAAEHEAVYSHLVLVPISPHIRTEVPMPMRIIFR